MTDSARTTVREVEKALERVIDRRTRDLARAPNTTGRILLAVSACFVGGSFVGVAACALLL